MVDDNKELVEKMLVAFLTEKSAQCGEPFYMDMWEEYKREKPEEYHEEFVQMQCALSIIQPELARKDKIIDAYERGVAMINNAVSDAQSIIDLRKLKTTTDCPASLSPTGDAQTAAMNQHGTSEDAQNGGVKTTTGHDNNTQKRGKR